MEDAQGIARSGVQINKWLRDAQLGSRRGCDVLVNGGRVAINGEVAVSGAMVHPSDDVTLDGKSIAAPTAVAQVVLYHKPEGVTVTKSDVHAELSYVQALPHLAHLFSVGRLDKDTTGLLLLTNDGELAHRLTHPRYGVEKEYRVVVEDGDLATALARLRRGVLLEEHIAIPVTVSLVVNAPAPTFDLVLTEGRKREVRRMVALVGLDIVSLERRRFGPVELGDLGQGATRHLSQSEVAALRATVGL